MRAYGWIAGVIIALFADCGGQARGQEKQRVNEVEWKFVEATAVRSGLEYGLARPRDFDREKEYPVVVALAPGEMTREMAERAYEMYWKSEAGRRGWVVVLAAMPRMAPGIEKNVSVEQRRMELSVVERAMDLAAQEVLVRGGRFHLAGVSNGGRAALRVAMARAWDVSSVTALPGYLEDADLAQASRLRGVRVNLFVGEKDAFWLEKSRATQRALVGADVRTSFQAMEGEEHVIKSLSGAGARRIFDLMEASEEPALEDRAESSALRRRDEAMISRTLDDLHERAANADEAGYFSLFADDGVFLGTDGLERWSVGEFRRYAHEAFSKGKGWTYTPTRRSVRVDESGKTGWFEETLAHEKFGECRGSGVVSQGEAGWKIRQYVLSVPIPNELIHAMTKVIRDRAATDAASGR